MQLSPTKLDDKRNTPDLPPSLAGKSFTDTTVRTAFKQKALELASLQSDQLVLATEINLLASNPSEFGAFKSPYSETYDEIKERYPTLSITASFQYDLMKAQNNWNIIQEFGAMDIISFTPYPYVVSPNIDSFPKDYFLDARKKVSNNIPIGFSELDWSSAIGGQEAQDKFYA